MSFSNLQFPSTVSQCGQATFSFEGGQFPARVELYFQNGSGPWSTTGETTDVYSSPHVFTINVPAGMTVWPTITGHDGSYDQIRVGSTVQASGNDACLPTSGTLTATVTDISTAVSTRTITQTDRSTVVVNGGAETVEAARTETVVSTVTQTMDGAEDDADFTADSSWALGDNTSLDPAPTGGMRPEVGASFDQLQASASSYRSATYALAALFAAACLGILFLLFVLRRTRRRRQQPLRPRIARFTDDGSFMSERSTAPSYGAEASSSPFSAPIPAVTPSIARSPTLRNSLGFSVDRRNSNTGPQPPVSSLFLQVPNNRGDNSVDGDENELSRMGTINSVDERQTNTNGLQNLYVRNHSQFTLNSANSDNGHQY